MISLFWSWSALGRFSALQVSRQYDRRVPEAVLGVLEKQTFNA